jgi:SAM-dependent methyltransferase
MDANSINIMKAVVDELGLSDKFVVDMGSYDVNGTYRGLFTGRYVGVDIIPGPNVDVGVGTEEWNALDSVDAVISGQTIEHVADIPEFMAGIFRILKPGGILCIIAPSEGPGHDYPIWVGNFPPDRMRQAVEDGGFEVQTITVSEELPWKLCCCVARKPVEIVETIEDVINEPITRKRKERNEAE